MLRTLIAALAATLPHAASASATEPASPTASYWHLWTDKAGQSHMTECPLSAFVLQSMNKPADPQWQDRLGGTASVIFTVQPAEWNGDWHEDPHVQFVVPLKGSWFVEGQDGKRVEMGPGTVFLGEDQNTEPDANGHKGHLSGNVGNGPVTLMIASLDWKPTAGQPCHVK
jgi:hypothetical protein